MNKKDLEKEIKKIDAELKTHEEIIKLVSELKKKKSKLKEELDSLYQYAWIGWETSSHYQISKLKDISSIIEIEWVKK